MIRTKDIAEDMSIVAIEMPIFSATSLYGGYVPALEHMRG
jgi:hypothetical protein